MKFEIKYRPRVFKYPIGCKYAFYEKSVTIELPSETKTEDILKLAILEIQNTTEYNCDYLWIGPIFYR